ncbi:O-Antigen ligase [Halogranum rubrum]|uniref:O-Antigen ligase n=1 Tax=Halogranum rubrum TaxID=553466 RepID=A0A1I4BLU8_9EURY|nr:O-antigen ligase family protein [Halogranum rubrum]SFK69350.1 O-Antigen ligase [Halogranum rubrum]
MRTAYRHGIVSASLLLPVTLLLGVLLQQTPVPLPGLVSLALTLSACGAYILYTKEYRVGFLALFAVTSTVSANVPVLGRPAAFAGPSVGSIVLVEIVAIPGIVYLLYDWRDWDHVEVLLTAYSIWAAVSVVFGVGPAKIAGVWFAAYSLMGVISYALFRRAVQREVVSGVEAVSLFLFAAAGQGVVAFCQFLNTANFGLTTLGEGGNSDGVYLSLLTHKVPIGTHISGFMSMSFEFANYLVLLLPVVVALAVMMRRQKHVSIALGFAAVLAGLGVQLTMSDAARGGMILALVGLLVSLLAMKTDKRAVLGAAVPLLPAFIRSTTSGQGTTIETGGSEQPEGTSTPTGTQSGSEPTGGTSTPTGMQDGSNSVNVSVPFFDLSNLGVRLQQYVIGIQMSLNHPLFGVGAANYQLVAMSYDAPYPPGAEYPYPAHSIYVTLLAETGIPGFTLYSLAGALVVLAGLYYGVKKDDLLAVGLACGLLGTFAFGAFDILQLYYPTAFIPIWCLAGILAGHSSGFSLPIEPAHQRFRSAL